MPKAKKNPHSSGVDHPFGAVHLFTDGQLKMINDAIIQIIGNEYGSSYSRYDYYRLLGTLYTWRDMLFATAVGIALGIIIAHIK